MSASPFWVTFSDRQAACVEVPTGQDPIVFAQRFGRAVGAARLPYPGMPRLNVLTDCPSFCFDPHQCAGRSCCPRSYACSE